jgi:hypothetical protein
MNTLQQTAIATISKLPHTTNFENIIANSVKLIIAKIIVFCIFLKLTKNN